METHDLSGLTFNDEELSLPELKVKIEVAIFRISIGEQLSSALIRPGRLKISK